LKTDKSPEPDSLHPRLLFEIKESLTEPWSIIFNQSLALKTVPKERKNAQISAISFSIILQTTDVRLIGSVIFCL
jgi:hypothetical protein